MRLIIALALAAAVTAVSFAQTPDARGARSDAILNKVRQIDLLNHMLPVMMTKEQIRKLLPVLEKARQKVTDAQKKEYDLLVSFEKKIDDAIDKAYKDNLTPGRTVTGELLRGLQAMGIARSAVADENTEEVLKAFKAELNAGQLKSAANSLNLKVMDPTLKPEEMTEDAKLRIYIREIFLDPISYDVLVKLSK